MGGVCRYENDIEISDTAVWLIILPYSRFDLDIFCMDDDGNVLDASVLALLAALKQCKCAGSCQLTYRTVPRPSLCDFVC